MYLTLRRGDVVDTSVSATFVQPNEYLMLLGSTSNAQITLAPNQLEPNRVPRGETGVLRRISLRLTSQDSRKSTNYRSYFRRKSAIFYRRLSPFHIPQFSTYNLYSRVRKHLLLGTSLDSGLSHLASNFLLDNGLFYVLDVLMYKLGWVKNAYLDDTDGDGLTHITDSKTSKWWVVGEGLNAHWLGWLHLDNGGITRLDELWLVLNGLTGTAIDLLEDLSELAGNMGGVAIQDWCVTGADLTWVVQDDNLGVERLSSLWWIVLGVTADVTTTDFLDGNVLDVEANVISWNTLDKLLVVHLNGLNLSGDTSWGEGDDHTGLDDTGLNTTDWHRANTANLVNILEWKTEWLIGWAGRWVDGINGLEESLSGLLALLSLLLPTLVPWAVGGGLNHVVTVESGDWNESNRLWVVADLLDETGGLLDDLLETVLGPLGGVHLVDGNDELLNTKGVGEKSVLTGLTILGDTSLELTSTSGNDENGAIGLGGTSDHVLDEISVTWGIDDGDVVLWGLELPESDIDGDTTLTLSLEFVKNPCVLERTLSELGGLLCGC